MILTTTCVLWLFRRAFCGAMRLGGSLALPDFGLGGSLALPDRGLCRG